MPKDVLIGRPLRLKISSSIDRPISQISRRRGVRMDLSSNSSHTGAFLLKCLINNPVIQLNTTVNNQTSATTSTAATCQA